MEGQVNYPVAKRGKSPKPWIGVPSAELLQDMSAGWRWRMDPEVYSPDSYTLAALTGSAQTLTPFERLGGSIQLDVGATTTDHGAYFQHFLGEGRFLIGAASRIVFEWAGLVTGSTLPDAFIGLAKGDTQVMTTDGFSTSSEGIGFEMIGTSDIRFLSRGSASETLRTTLGTVTTATFMKLAFVIDGTSSAQAYINGAAVGSPIVDNFSALYLAPSIGMTNNNSVRGLVDTVWGECVQLNSAAGA